jgi:hypothetical protein
MIELGVEGVGLEVTTVGAKPYKVAPFKTPLIACYPYYSPKTATFLFADEILEELPEFYETEVIEEGN